MNVGKHLEIATQTIQIVCIKLKEINFDLTDDANILSFKYICYMHFQGMSCLVKHTKAK